MLQPPADGVVFLEDRKDLLGRPCTFILHRLNTRMSISALWGLLPLTHQSVFVTGHRVLLISRLSAAHSARCQ